MTARLRPAWWRLAAVAALAFACTMPTALPARVSPRPQVGQVPPDALGRDQQGVEQRISAHRGKVVVVTFWASWCAPCLRELPLLGRLQQAVGREHLVVIAVNVKEPRSAMQPVIDGQARHPLLWVHDTSGATSARYGVDALPQMVVIDRDGRVARVHRGYNAARIDEYVRGITALLPPGAPAFDPSR